MFSNQFIYSTPNITLILVFLYNINSLNSYIDFHDRKAVQTRLRFHPRSWKDHQKAFGGQWNHLQVQGKLIYIWVLVGFFSQHPLNIIKNKQNCFVDVNTCVGFIKISTRVPFFNWLPVLQITSCYVVSGSFRSQLFTAYRANWMVAEKRKRIFHCISKNHVSVFYLFISFKNIHVQYTRTARIRLRSLINRTPEVESCVNILELEVGKHFWKWVVYYTGSRIVR